jgi:hypothetical protein
VDEVKDKSGKQIDVVSWKQEGVQNLPLQENGYFLIFSYKSAIVFFCLTVKIGVSIEVSKRELHETFFDVGEKINFPHSVPVLDGLFVILDGIVACSCSNTLTSTAEIWILFLDRY